MQTSFINNTSFYQTTFNNAILHCMDDQDCPGSCTCWTNKTSSISFSHCGPNLHYGMVGLQCEVLGSGGIPIVIICSIAIVLSVIAIILSGYVIWLMSSSVPKEQRWEMIANNVIYIDSWCVFIGSISAIAYDGLFLHVVTGKVLLQYNPVLKEKQVDRAYYVPLSLNIIFTTFAALLIGLQWLDIASKTKVLSHKNTRGVRARYSLAIKVYFILVSIAFIILFALFKENLVSYLVVPGLLFMVIVYGMGAINMRQLLQEALQNVRNPDSDRGMKSSLHLISIAAGGISITILIIIIFMCAFLGIGLDAGDLPNYPVGWYVLRPVYLLMSVVQVEIMVYLYPLAWRIIRKWRGEKSSTVEIDQQHTGVHNNKQESAVRMNSGSHHNDSNRKLNNNNNNNGGGGVVMVPVT
jgi:hypothetical protein